MLALYKYISISFVFLNIEFQNSKGKLGKIIYTFVKKNFGTPIRLLPVYSLYSDKKLIKINYFL